MKFHVLTLFPDMIRQGMDNSVIGRAIKNNSIEIDAVNIRDFTEDRHGKVDDYPYGGGAGMLMQAQPVYDAWKNTVKDRAVRTIYVSPQGRTFTQAMASEYAREEELVILCGHYEGIDERVLEEIVTDTVSIGDYVLTGGELPAMVLMDAIARLVPGVLHNDQSSQTESFYNDLLEYPQYSRPEEWHGKRVPAVLLSGDHGSVRKWRLQQSKERTERMRPDLYQKYAEKEKLIERLSRNKRYYIHMMESLARGRAEILYWQGANILLYDASCKLFMIDAEPGSDTAEMLALIPEDTTWVLSSKEFLNDLLEEKLGRLRRMECRQACYTQKNPMPVRYKDIRKLTEENVLYVTERYPYEKEEYIRERISAGAMYGAFDGDRQIGFMGWHPEGSLGMLYVDPKYRGRAVGSSLEAYCVNLHLQQGYIPYGHVQTDNLVSMAMQEKMGFLFSKESLWWLECASRWKE